MGIALVAKHVANPAMAEMVYPEDVGTMLTKSLAAIVSVYAAVRLQPLGLSVWSAVSQRLTEYTDAVKREKAAEAEASAQNQLVTYLGHEARGPLHILTASISFALDSVQDAIDAAAAVREETPTAHSAKASAASASTVPARTSGPPASVWSVARGTGRTGAGFSVRRGATAGGDDEARPPWVNAAAAAAGPPGLSTWAVDSLRHTTPTVTDPAAEALRSAETDLGTCSAAAMQLTSLLGSVLDFSLVRSSRLAMEPCRVDIATVARGCLARAADRAKVPLFSALQSAAGAPVPQSVVTDGSRLQQALEWALRSSVDFTSDGMVALAICVETAEGTDHAVPWWRDSAPVNDEDEDVDTGVMMLLSEEPELPQASLLPPSSAAGPAAQPEAPSVDGAAVDCSGADAHGRGRGGGTSGTSPAASAAAHVSLRRGQPLPRERMRPPPPIRSVPGTGPAVPGSPQPRSGGPGASAHAKATAIPRQPAMVASVQRNRKPKAGSGPTQAVGPAVMPSVDEDDQSSRRSLLPRGAPEAQLASMSSARHPRPAQLRVNGGSSASSRLDFTSMRHTGSLIPVMALPSSGPDLTSTPGDPARQGDSAESGGLASLFSPRAAAQPARSRRDSRVMPAAELDGAVGGARRFLVLRVLDTGTPLDSKVHLDETLNATAEHRTTGLGRVLARELVTLMGGVLVQRQLQPAASRALLLRWDGVGAERWDPALSREAPKGSAKFVPLSTTSPGAAFRQLTSGRDLTAGSSRTLGAALERGSALAVTEIWLPLDVVDSAAWPEDMEDAAEELEHDFSRPCEPSSSLMHPREAVAAAMADGSLEPEWSLRTSSPSVEGAIIGIPILGGMGRPPHVLAAASAAGGSAGRGYSVDPDTTASESLDNGDDVAMSSMESAEDFHSTVLRPHAAPWVPSLEPSSSEPDQTPAPSNDSCERRRVDGTEDSRRRSPSPVASLVTGPAAADRIVPRRVRASKAEREARRQARASAHAGAPKPTMREGGSKRMLRVLFVDDDEIVRRTTERMLRRLGAEPTVLCDGNEVEPWLREHADLGQRPVSETIDMVLSDIVMPGMDGETLCRRLADHAINVPVVAATGTAAPEALRRFPEAGFSGVLCKPYSADQLGEVLDAVRRGVLPPPGVVKGQVDASRQSSGAASASLKAPQFTSMRFLTPKA